MSKKEPKTLSEAIENLESSAGEKVDNIKGFIQNNLKDVLEALEDLQPQIKELRGQVETEVSKKKKQVEAKVKKNPWIAIGVIGIIAFILGWIFAGHRLSSDHQDKGGNEE